MLIIIKISTKSYRRRRCRGHLAVQAIGPVPLHHRFSGDPQIYINTTFSVCGSHPFWTGILPNLP